MKGLGSIAVVILAPVGFSLAQSPASDERIRALEQQLSVAQGRVVELQGTIDGLATAIAALKESRAVAIEPPVAAASDATEGYAERIIVQDLSDDEREARLAARPEFFVQSRFHANPIQEALPHDVTRNFALARMEMRWAGRVAERVGLGFELQFHPAPTGAAEELVNDAYVEYYPSSAVTFRVGQFVKPFGFDIQHSSGDRESPERGIFAGYFFPGQRDRGLMLAADLDGFAPWLSGTSAYAALLNGNRFFDDNNDDLNYVLRVRKVFDSLPLAIGASAQFGTQLLPPSVIGSNDEDIYGVDIQYVIGRLGIRGEYLRGNMPSTLLSLEPEFAPAFVPGEKSSGAAAFFNYTLTARDDIYWRWDRFDNDPVSGHDIRAFNVGYLRAIGANSRIGIDYQTKNDVTLNDDELNTKFSITWNLQY